jgi:hypothetical protein
MTNALSNIEYLAAGSMAEEAAEAPKTLINASLGRTEGSLRPKGLILTKEHIKDLYRYEQKGLQLPTAAENVSVYLGYAENFPPGKGLAVSDFVRTFSVIKAHASQWNGLRQRIKQISSELKVFAGEIAITHKYISHTLGSLTALKILDDLGIETLEDLKRVQAEMGDRFPHAELDPADANRAKGIHYYLSQLLDEINAQAHQTSQLKKDLDGYASALANNVRPEISLRLVAIDNNDFKDDVIRLQSQINELNKEIDEKSASYKKIVNDSLTSASSLNVVGLGMAIYFGVEAEKVRKERNALRRARDAKNNEMGKKSTVLKRLNDVKADMQEIEYLTLQADVATQNLVTVWNKLHLYLQASLRNSKVINNAIQVCYIAFHFDKVVAPWALILQDADELHAVWDEADAEIKHMTL